MSINQVSISGNLTRDPEMRRTQSGLAILSFTVAVNDRKKNNSTGDWEDVPNFIDCNVFGAYAEYLENNLIKGMKVFVSGKLHWNQWEKDGKKRTKVDVTADTVEYLRPTQSVSKPQQATYPVYDENIPF